MLTNKKLPAIQRSRPFVPVLDSVEQKDGVIYVTDQDLEYNPSMKNYIDWSKSTIDSEGQVVHALVLDSEYDGTTSSLAFVYSALTYLDRRYRQVLYGDLTGKDDVPLSSANVSPAQQHYKWVVYDGTAIAKFISGGTSNFPIIELEATSFQVDIGHAGNGIEYTHEELRTAAASGIDTLGSKYEFSKRGYEEFCNNVLYYGAKDKKMTGLLNNPNVPLVLATKKLSEMDGLELAKYFLDLIKEVIMATKAKHRPDTMLLSPEIYSHLSKTLLVPYFDKTVLEFIQEKNLATLESKKPLDIKLRFALEKSAVKANIEDTKYHGENVLVYEKDEQNMAYVSSMGLQQIPSGPQFVKQYVQIFQEFKQSGVIFYRPMSAIQGVVEL